MAIAPNTDSNNTLNIQLFACIIHNIFKAFNQLAIDLNQVFPHRAGAHPQSPLTIKGFVDDHFLQALAVPCKTDNLIMVPFEVAVYTKQDVAHGLTFLWL